MMKRPTISVAITFLIVCVLLPCAVYVFLVYKQGIDIKLGLVRREGSELVNCIKNIQEHDSKWPTVHETKMPFTNSTDYFSVLIKNHGIIRGLFTHSSSAVKEASPEIAGLSAKNNFWTAIKNLPTNAPGHVVVLASRNINPASLRTRLSKGDMDKEISFNLEGESGLLRDYAILIRNDGNGLIFRCRRGLFSSSWRYRRCGYIYSGKPFDLTTNDISGLNVTYLTPAGEVMPENR